MELEVHTRRAHGARPVRVAAYSETDLGTNFLLAEASTYVNHGTSFAQNETEDSIP